ncbi:MAG: site-2 protease family protein [bacterium]|nr:site-2 protease family protein [bacterium]
MQVELIFSIAVLIMSVVIHEVAHGAVAGFLGDPTARLAGRLTLNPIKHLDLFGSIILPVGMAFIGGPIFGWAKPVPYNPYNIKVPWGEAAVAAAGPASNLIIALIFSFLLRVGLVSSWFGAGSVSLVLSIVFINIILAVFNLIPVPPLDGSKILFNLLPSRLRFIEAWFTQYQLFFLILIIVFVGAIIGPVSSSLFHLFTGLNI